jgi:hypothetical protein
MLTRVSAAVLVACAVVTLLPLPGTFAGTAPEEPPTPTILPPTEKELSKITAALEKATADKDDKLMAAALFEMAGVFAEPGKVPIARTHDSFIPYIRTGLKSKDLDVQRMAIMAAASHEMKGVQKDIVKLLKSRAKKKKKKKKRKAGSGLGPQAVRVACVEYLDRLEIAGYEELVFEDYLRPLFRDESGMKRQTGVDVLRAGIRIIGRAKYKPAVAWCIENLDEPVPANPGDANNPPESYWKARYKLWQQSEGWFRWALKELTDKEFRSTREWKAWYSRNKKDFK